MEILYLVRHCEAAGQAAEAPLTEAGRQQAQQLAAILQDKHITYVLASPYARAIASIQPFANARQLPIYIDSRLSERILCAAPLPDWQETLAYTFQDEHFSMPGGESSYEAMSRAAAVLQDIRKQAGVGVVVTHGNLLTLLLRHLDGVSGFQVWQSLSNPDVYEVLFEPSLTVRRIWEEV